MQTFLPEYIDPVTTFPPLKDAVAEFTACYLRTALKRTGGHQQKAAAELGIHRNTLIRRCAEVGIPRRYGKPSRTPKQNPKWAVARRIIGLGPLPPKKPFRAITLDDLPKRSVARQRMLERLNAHSA